MTHGHHPIPDDFHPTFTDDTKRQVLIYRDIIVSGEGAERREVHLETGLRYATVPKATVQERLRALAWSLREHCRCGTHHVIRHHTKQRHDRRGFPSPAERALDPQLEAELNAPYDPTRRVGDAPG